MVPPFPVASALTQSDETAPRTVRLARRLTVRPAASSYLLRRTHHPADHRLRTTRKNGKEMTMDARLDYFGSPLALKLAKHINSGGGSA